MRLHNELLVSVMALGIGFMLPLGIQKFISWFIQQDPLVGLAVIGSILACTAVCMFLWVNLSIEGIE